MNDWNAGYCLQFYNLVFCILYAQSGGKITTIDPYVALFLLQCFNILFGV